MQRRASAIWKGSLRDGDGTLATESRALHAAPYSFYSRFESDGGTNPEELIGAAHASCYSMALAALLDSAGMHPRQISTVATVTLDSTDEGFAVVAVHLDVSASVQGASPETFEATALSARRSCPVSRLLNTKITLDARLED